MQAEDVSWGRVKTFRFDQAVKGVAAGAVSVANTVLWWILIGILAAAIIGAYVPEHCFMQYLGPESFSAVLDLGYTAISIRQPPKQLEPPMKSLPLDQWDESLEHVIEDMRGHPLNVHGLMANHPDLLNAWWDYRNHAVRGGALAQRDSELVILRVAVHMRSWYEWACHVDRGLAVGLSIEDIERVREGPQAAGWSDHDAILLRCVDELLDKRAISAESAFSIPLLIV